MSLFTSKELKSDPTPWVDVLGQRSESPFGHGDFLPRPELSTFNPPNQILLNFRTTVGAEREWLLFLATMELQAIRKRERTYFSKAEQEHAEKVLERIQRIYGESE